jgi:hypothetical protein
MHFIYFSNSAIQPNYFSAAFAENRIFKSESTTKHNYYLGSMNHPRHINISQQC